MIKIELPVETKQKIEELHWKYFKDNGLSVIKEVISHSTGRNKEFFQYVLDDANDNKYLKEIIIGEPKILRLKIDDLDTEFYDLFNPLTVKTFKDYIEKVFNYDSFRNRDKTWGAYLLTSTLNIKTCPYCNRQFTNTFYSADGKTRPEIDHFFPRYKYPYLSISLYNFIPSCKICNSSLKGVKDFYLEPHVHPYEDAFYDSAIFRTNIKSDERGNYPIEFLYGNGEEKDFELMLKVNEDSILIDKIKNSNKTFKIEELYQFHKDYVLEIIKKTVFYNHSRIYELAKSDTYKGLFTGPEEIIQILIGNYVAKNKLGKRVLAKLTKDIWEEFRLDEVWLT